KASLSLLPFSLDKNGKNHSELVDKEELNLFLVSLVHLHYLLFLPCKSPIFYPNILHFQNGTIIRSDFMYFWTKLICPKAHHISCLRVFAPCTLFRSYSYV